MISSEDLFQQGLFAHRNGELDVAHENYRKTLAMDPDHAEALHLSGLIFAQKNQIELAIQTIQKSLAINPQNPLALHNLGKVFISAGSLHLAIDLFDKALHLNPKYAQARINLGKALSDTGQHYAAIHHLVMTIGENPLLTEAHLLLVTSLAALHQFDAAIEHLHSLSKEHNQGLLQARMGQLVQGRYDHRQRLEKLAGPRQAHIYLDAGLKSIRHQPQLAIEFFDAVLCTEPQNAFALFCKGNAHIALEQMYAAIECYDRSIAIDPLQMDAIFNCGSALFSLQKFHDAQVQFQRVLSVNPLDKNALFYLGLSLKEQFEYKPAIEKLQLLYDNDPDYALLLGHLISAKMNICDWDGIERLRNDLSVKLQEGKPVSTPFNTLAVVDSISLQRQTGQIYLNSQIKLTEQPYHLAGVQHSKIKVAYFSTDFRNHAVSILTAQLYELHDRNRFEVIAFSIGPDVRDEMNLRLRQSFDLFIDAQDWTERAIIMKARELELDVAVDLSGHTNCSKPGIFSQRVAPVQINWLGYPGPMGHPEMDYIIADRHVIPPHLQHAYSEKIINLPCFQVNDQSRKISGKVFTKQALGLPEHHFVYCSFNANAKFTPEIFKAWMQILSQVPQSSLLLYAENDDVKINLSHTAHSLGISPDRLVFAEWMEPADNLARFKTADLFLDTLPFNAGTTASDALWAGLPVLTCAGEAFASRMAASLLHAVDLPELVTYSLSDYITKAVALAQSAEGTQKLKSHLRATRDSCVLFDTPTFVAQLEAALIEICEGKDTQSSRI